MQNEELVNLVEQYFGAVDREDFLALSRTLAHDCTFRVETHGVSLHGINHIAQMFERLWANHASVKHKDFTHVPAGELGLIASRFLVENTEHDGSKTYKSNCNFFEVGDNGFRKISVYMAGKNTLLGG